MSWRTIPCGTAILPTHTSAPGGQAEGEAAVLVAEWQILARRGHQTSFSLAELNGGIRHRREALNQRPFQQLRGSRGQLFHELDQPVLRPLPVRRPLAQRVWEHFTTDPAHWPKACHQQLESTPGRLPDWAGNIGPRCGAAVRAIVESHPHPERRYHACLRVMRLGCGYGPGPTGAGDNGETEPGRRGGLGQPKVRGAPGD